jgi:hypothetical protein
METLQVYLDVTPIHDSYRWLYLYIITYLNRPNYDVIMRLFSSLEERRIDRSNPLLPYLRILDIFLDYTQCMPIYIPFCKKQRR